ncbi:MAG: thiamine-phosphate kinase [Cycloclasticus sp.]|nr:thiamine-phosphate kinase [Gammaproteobacteria bacterium]MBQ0790222.1 thiamine-phosphate kinase [Cycloclasticus sp.]
MPASEFSLIKEFFTDASDFGLAPVIGIGDDCAVLDIPSDQQLAVSTDTLVDGVHFLTHSDPCYLGHKVLAVNLSDLAAMGATPVWATLSITLPEMDASWLRAFSEGFFALAKAHSLRLIGGDTTRGPLSVTLTVMGLLPKNKRLSRSAAQLGDGIYLSGSVGNAGLGLHKAQMGSSDINDYDLACYLKPMPRVTLGQFLLERATSCIDVSDGLSADLNHILRASGVGATIEQQLLPLTESVRQQMQLLNDPLWPCSTGDDYELCFTLPASMAPPTSDALQGLKISKIGVIEQNLGLRVKLPSGEVRPLDKGYDHFNE